MATDSPDHQWYLPEKSRQQLTEIFKQLVHPVNLHLYTLPGTNDLFNEFLLRFTADLARLSDRIVLHQHRVGSDEARGKSTYPALLGIKASRLLARESVDQALRALDGCPGGADFLRAVARYILDRTN